DAFVALAADTGRPLHRSAFADLFLPLRADLGQVVDEIEGGTGTVGTVDDGDLPRRQLEASVERGDPWIVPLPYLAQEYVGEQGTVELQRARLDARNVHHRDDATDHRRELDQAGFGKGLGLE